MGTLKLHGGCYMRLLVRLGPLRPRACGWGKGSEIAIAAYVCQPRGGRGRKGPGGKQHEH